MQRLGTQYSAFEANRTRIHKTVLIYTFLEFSVGQYHLDLDFSRSLRSHDVKTMDDNVLCN